MARSTVLFVAHLEQDNLGIGYVASMLQLGGYKIVFSDVTQQPGEILSQIKRHRPLIVGFSIIFQYQIHQYAELISYLRSAGVDCHFTAGGHFPSLRFKENLEYVQGLDSIVLFEGEHTMLALANNLRNGGDWRRLRGMAFRSARGPRQTALRKVERHLDHLPIPIRISTTSTLGGLKVASVLASRGCYYNCTYCSIRQFYTEAGGQLKRFRNPDAIVAEMKLLMQQDGYRVFLFQDDDFPMAGRFGRAWANQFCDSLEQAGIHHRVIWKISCRVNELDRDLLVRFSERGLFHVYLGIESGCDQSLREMNKKATSEGNLEATQLLRELNMSCDYGFMLFEPSSTFASVAQNLEFLKTICSEGVYTVTFCKMLPYAGTEVERGLRAQGRLIGGLGLEDYRLLDPLLDHYSRTLLDACRGWILDRNGVTSLARSVQLNLTVRKRLKGNSRQIERLANTAGELAAQSNRFLLDHAIDLLSLYSRGSEVPPHHLLSDFHRQVATAQASFARRMRQLFERQASLV